MENRIITESFSRLTFRVYSSEEVLKTSVKEVTDPQIFDNLQLPTIGGLYDPAFGATRNDDVCTTCGQAGRFCPGHFGHISLALPVFRPVFFKTLFKILRATCLSCHHLFLKEEEGMSFVHQMKLVEYGYVTEAKNLRDYVLSFKAEKEEHFSTFKERLYADLDKMVKETIGERSRPMRTKMVQAEMAELVNDMLKQFSKVPRKCPQCETTSLSLRHEYSSRITAGGALIKNNTTASKENPASHLTEAPETEADLEEIEDNEMETLLEKGKGQCLVMPHSAKQILSKVIKNDGHLLRKVFHFIEDFKDPEHAADIFFQDVVMVSANRFRPMSVVGDRKFENTQTANLSRILTVNHEIKQLLTGMSFDVNKSTDLTQPDVDSAIDNLWSKWTLLQTSVNSLIDSDLNKLSNQSNKPQGIRQLMEKKDGLFRKHMMGKRVNYAARSVISPDPFISTNEIGVPQVFAQKLTYPETVTPFNAHELRQMVINGPATYPGASAVVNGDGSMVKLDPNSKTQRVAIAKQLLTPSSLADFHDPPKKVLRHLKNGDAMLLNRQPTLHRPSIQAHKARVLPGIKTLRLHYSNCKAYNADFDGDEMNAHFPQSELGRAEAYGIASTDFQYLVPKDGTPLAGLIQDHLVAGVTLTARGEFFNREDYCNLLQAALTDVHKRLHLLPPAIVKPYRLWSGKQIVSTVLKNIIPKDKAPLNMDSKAKIPERSWITGDVRDPWRLEISKEELEELGESTVLVDKGELLQGVLDKAQCGPSSFGLVHCVYELYGGEIAGQLLTCLGRLFTAYLKRRGFTLGIEDILVKKKAESKRKKLIKHSQNKGFTAALEAFGTTKDDISDAELLHKMKKAQFSEDDLDMQKLDMTAKRATFQVQDKISTAIMSKNLHKSFPDNNLQLMVQSGAKGSSVNCMQISCLLGQIELEGRRPPLMQSGRSLPSFLPYDLSLRSRGFVTDRFLTGLRPQEYFFHCMAGREGLVDTAVKTSRSGYLQRCLVKHLEGLSVKYDMTVRDSDSSVIQFLYGEDGLDVTKASVLEEKQLPFLLKNQSVMKDNTESGKASKSVEKYNKKIKKWNRKHPKGTGRESGFLEFCRRKRENTVVNGDAAISETTGRSAHSRVLEIEWRSLDPKEKRRILKKHKPCPDPAMSKFWPQLETGVLSEKLQKSVNIIQDQLREVGRSSEDENKVQQSVLECERLSRLVSAKVKRSLCEPGEAVGLVCAQSLGEQTTQMTLNTFHFAGRGEMNVTMGIPRLREILMTASSTMLTPSMDVPVLDTPEAEAAAKELKLKLNCVFLSDVLQDVRISDSLDPSPHSTGKQKRLYRIRFNLLPRESYHKKSDLKPKAVVKLIEKNFIGRLGEMIHRTIEKLKMEPSNLVSQATVRNVERNESVAAASAADDGESDVENHDGDAAAVKELQRHSGTQEYEGEEEERREVGDSTQPDDMEEDTQPDEGETEQDEDTIEDEDIARVKSGVRVRDYKRGKKGRWCEVVYEFEAQRFLVNVKSVVDREVGRFPVQRIPGLKRCILAERTDDERHKRQKRLYLVTDGINLKEIMKYGQILELNAISTNNIVEIQNTFGIEAARRAVIKEVQKVFQAFCIQVSYRHLSLLADFMTTEGYYKGFNRTAMASNPSPIQKITFETSTSFLINACLNAWPDVLQSPSAQIVAGLPVASGNFEIIHRLQV